MTKFPPQARRFRHAALGAIFLALLAPKIIYETFLPIPAFAQELTQFTYRFSQPGSLYESATAANSHSPYFWLSSGGRLDIKDGVGLTIQGDLPKSDPQRATYARESPVVSDAGAHPQNYFKLLTKQPLQNVSASMYVNRKKDNLANFENRHAYSGESVFVRYIDEDTFYYAGIREDGNAVIKKRTNGKYQTLVIKKIFPGSYSASNPNLIPSNTWIGLKVTVTDTSNGPRLVFYTDVGKTGTWTQQVSVVDDPKKFGAAIMSAGTIGLESDFADAQIDDLVVTEIATQKVAPTAAKPVAPKPVAPVVTPAPTNTPPSTNTSYDALVLKDKPVLYLPMKTPGSGKESDTSGNGHHGSYKGGTPAVTKLPNGDSAVAFNGSSQYVTVPSHSALSIPTTKKLTWEAWIRPDTLQFAHTSGGYIDWMGKCENYSPSCEWEARMYNQNNSEGRTNRLSAYVFNNGAGLGSGADWQPASSIISAGKWLHVVAEYDLTTTPTGCSSAQPGQIQIWVNGVKWSQKNHMPTGCMSQFKITPKASNSPLNIGTMAMDTWFKGAVGKVAVYNYLLSQTQITDHYLAMTGKSPSGSCGETCTSEMP